MAITLSKPPRSSLSNFFHDLVTVDFHQIDINTGMRIAAILVIITVVGLITGHAAESGLVTIGALWVCIGTQCRSHYRLHFLFIKQIEHDIIKHY
jgi:hypothetical protein